MTPLGYFVIFCFFVSCMNIFTGVLWFKSYRFAKYQLAIGLIGAITFCLNMVTWQLR